jgi:hypothetical protein
VSKMAILKGEFVVFCEEHNEQFSAHQKEFGLTHEDYEKFKAGELELKVKYNPDTGYVEVSKEDTSSGG